MQYSKNCAGNALIFILIAIFLLAGLTVLLSRTGSQSEDTGGTEQIRIQASEILKYASGIQNAVQMLRNRGCSENTLSFWNKDTNTSGGENTGDDYYNASALTNKSCHVFNPAGA